MIDTVKFKIPINDGQFRILRSQSIEIRRYDHKQNIDLVRYHTIEVNLPSFNRSINIFLPKQYEGFLQLELSLPKFHFGHNIFLLYGSDLQRTLFELHDSLRDFFGFFPSISDWHVQKIDLCYAWKFRTQQEAEIVFSTVRKLGYLRKKAINYDTSVMYKGSSYNVKWYLKEPEFFAHDFKHLKRFDIDRAYQLLGFSSGVLRFEISILHKHFLTMFGKLNFTALELSDDFLMPVLIKYFNKSFQFVTDEVVTSQSIMQKLRSHFTKEYSVRLFTFYNSWFSSYSEDRVQLLKEIPKSTLSKYKNDLKRIKIGMRSVARSPLGFVSIPSSIATS